MSEREGGLKARERLLQQNHYSCYRQHCQYPLGLSFGHLTVGLKRGADQRPRDMKTIFLDEPGRLSLAEMSPSSCRTANEAVVRRVGVYGTGLWPNSSPAGSTPGADSSKPSSRCESPAPRPGAPLS